MSAPTFTDFKVLSFDIYGTLIDWDSGFYAGSKALQDRLPSSSPLKQDRAAFVAEITRLKGLIEGEHPGLAYSSVLAQAYTRFAQDRSLQVPAEEAERFGNSIGEWSAFDDTVDAMQRLSQHYRLIALSNIDRTSLQNSLAGPLKGVKFDFIYTADEVGSYKPDHKNFEYLLEHARVQKKDLLHVAHSLYYDQVPAKEMGLTSVWIARGDDDQLEDFKNKTAFSWRFATLGEMADAVEAEFGKQA